MRGRRFDWWRMSAWTATLLVALTAGWIITRLQAYERHLTLSEVVPPTTGGALVIGGGGPMPPAVKKEFLGLAGGTKARLIVIPAGTVDSGQEYTFLDDWRALGAESANFLNAESRGQADSEEFARPIADCTGVWFSGGNQNYLSGLYVGTTVERQLLALLRRGGVIGGTSAGAAIMSPVMIAGGRGQPVSGCGLNLFPEAVIDQHFFRRNRLNRLLATLQDHPNLIGFGIDERTALVVFPDTGALRVVGDSYVMACLPPSTTAHGRQFQILQPGQTTTLGNVRNGDATLDTWTDLEAVLDAVP